MGGRTSERGPRRIDAVLVPGRSTQVHPRDSYRFEEAYRAIHGSAVHLLEAKRILNRNVIGQVHVGVDLLERDSRRAPSKASPSAVTATRRSSGTAGTTGYRSPFIRRSGRKPALRNGRETPSYGICGSRLTRPGDVAS